MDELTELRQLETEAADDARRATDRHQRILRLIAKEEARLANKPVAREHPWYLRPLVVIPAGVGGAAAARQWTATYPHAALAGGTAAGTAIGALAAVLLMPGDGPERIVEPPPPLAAPPGVRSVPHVGPSKSETPAAAPTTSGPGALPPARRTPSHPHPTLSLPTTVTPPGGPLPTDVPTVATPSSAPTVERTCRIRLFRVRNFLREGLLCNPPRL